MLRNHKKTTMTDKKKEQTDLAVKNLAQLQKIDIAASKILDKKPFAAIYHIDPVKKEWRETNCEGTLFIYKRADRPYFSFLIANRNDPADFIEPLTLNHCFRHDGNFIYFYKDCTSIQALWFHAVDDALKVFTLLQKLVDKLKASTTEQARAAAAAENKASAAAGAPRAAENKASAVAGSARASGSGASSAPVPTTAPQPNNAAQQLPAPTTSKTIDLLQMIKSAQNPQPKPAPNVTTKIEQAPATNNAGTQLMPALLQKLMIKEAGTPISADELEKDLLRTAKPKRNLLQDFGNSPSATSLAAISTKSVHGSEGDQDVDVADGELLEPLEASFVVGDLEAPVLNKEQFLAAIAHLMQTDDEFVSQIHRAYVSALHRRLNID